MQLFTKILESFRIVLINANWKVEHLVQCWVLSVPDNIWLKKTICQVSILLTAKVGHQNRLLLLEPICELHFKHVSYRCTLTCQSIPYCMSILRVVLIAMHVRVMSQGPYKIPNDMALNP